MTHQVILVGSKDRELAHMLQATGATVTTASGFNTLRIGNAAPQVLVVDVRNEQTIPTALAAIRRDHPTIGIVLIATRPDSAMMLDAIRTGVNELLTEPLNVDEMRGAIERVVGLSLGKKAARGRVYAFVGAKGGVGTTTIAVNVATALMQARSGRVLFVDLHPSYGDAALFLGAEPRFSVLDALENTHRLDEAYFKGVVVHTKTGVDLLASSDRVMVSPIDTHRLRGLLDFAARCYDQVVIDAPRSDSAMLDVFEGAASIVIVANQELSTVRGAARMAATLRQRYGRERVQVVVSRYDTVAEIGHEDIERATGGPIRHLFPSNYRLAVDALNKGQPIVVENHNKLAGAYVGFAHTLAGIAKSTKPEAPKSSGLLGRLTGRR